ncbi:MAG: hypothetical protein GY832_43450 [Chloroflexi bacterium]|nr:hypothetical protein [Chloroflexota bacterium]
MKHSMLITGGVVLVVLLLVGAAFVGGRMLSAQNQASDNANGDGRQMITTGPFGSSSVDIVSADEMPSETADAAGLFVRREDNSIFVGTGDIRIRMEADGEVGAGHDGPVVEVVVTHNTVVYCDKTRYVPEEAIDGKIQQVLKPGSLDEVDAHSIISAWGEERGDRMLADVLIYQGVGQ